MGLLTKWSKSVKERWLTWRTGKSTEEREWSEWYDTHVVWKASQINNMFMHFKHVIIVDPQKFMDPYEPFAWVPCKDARQYFWPERKLGENCVWRFERVIWDQWNGWVTNDIGGTDKVFVATNNDQDATILALLYS